MKISESIIEKENKYGKTARHVHINYKSGPLVLMESGFTKSWKSTSSEDVLCYHGFT